MISGSGSLGVFEETRSYRRRIRQEFAETFSDDCGGVFYERRKGRVLLSVAHTIKFLLMISGPLYCLGNRRCGPTKRWPKTESGFLSA